MTIKEGNWGKGGTVVFDSIDTKRGTARIVGNAGAGDIAVLRTVDGLTFIEETLLGTVNVTTVLARPLESTNRLVAVMSRHITSFGGPFPSQWHGTCRILE